MRSRRTERPEGEEHGGRGERRGEGHRESRKDREAGGVGRREGEVRIRTRGEEMASEEALEEKQEKIGHEITGSGAMKDEEIRLSEKESGKINRTGRKHTNKMSCELELEEKVNESVEGRSGWG